MFLTFPLFYAKNIVLFLVTFADVMKLAEYTKLNLNHPLNAIDPEQLNPLFSTLPIFH